MIAPPSKRVLVTGAGGQVGTELTVEAARMGFSVAALPHTDLDIADENAIAEAVTALKPDVVINAAAYTAVDKAESEPERAHAINARAPGFLGVACDRAGIPLLHISTDYVFDGNTGRPWREDDPVAPLGVYGASKAEGEDALRRATANHVILRTAWVFSPHGHNFVRTMLRLSSERDELSVVDDQLGCPTSATDVARVLLKLTSTILDDKTAGGEQPRGTFHFCNAGTTSWYGFARAIMAGAEMRGAPSAAVQPIPTSAYPTPAHRPANSALDCAKLKSVFGIEPRPWEEALDGVLDRLLTATSERKAEAT
ncbi:dTDP-4-dehydrorhamnose reductase [Parvibaculum sp.]|uniref:dTDP-4-dehydrorhamnose reductase n=1 Tax=Parvibaculum sp. TaxID=2024848 RepID=UPI0034A002D2